MYKFKLWFYPLGEIKEGSAKFYFNNSKWTLFDRLQANQDLEITYFTKNSITKFFYAKKKSTLAFCKDQFQGPHRVDISKKQL